nr:MAG TPA: hypothetical protein [Caudoviricetes sp.]
MQRQSLYYTIKRHKSERGYLPPVALLWRTLFKSDWRCLLTGWGLFINYPKRFSNKDF